MSVLAEIHAFATRIYDLTAAAPASITLPPAAFDKLLGECVARGAKDAAALQRGDTPAVAIETPWGELTVLRSEPV